MMRTLSANGTALRNLRFHGGGASLGVGVDKIGLFAVKELGGVSRLKMRAGLLTGWAYRVIIGARKTPLGVFHEEPLRACVGLVPHTLRARFGF